MRRLGPALVLVVALAGCTPAPPGPSAPLYQLPPRPVRAGETPLAHPPVVNGDTEFTVLGLSSLDSILGSHAEWRPKQGRLVRVRLVVANLGRSGTVFDTKAQRLVTADGAVLAPDPEAMLIKRQPGEFELGAAVRLEFDLYFDVPARTRPTALRVTGGATLFQTPDAPATDLPLS